MTSIRFTSYIPFILLSVCLIGLLIVAGCTDAQPKLTVEASDITITQTDAANETIWYTMTVTVTNMGEASANDVVAGITVQTPDPSQMSRMAHECVKFGTIAPGAVRSDSMTLKLEAGPVGYKDLVTDGDAPVVTAQIEQMEYLSLPF